MALTLLGARREAHAADRPYVTLRDDGTLADKLTTVPPVMNAVMKAFAETKQPIPDVLSVWTSFSMDKNDIETLFLPCKNDTTGIGLEQEYGVGAEVFASDYGELRSILLHNNVNVLDKRAAFQGAPLDGFAEYLFLLELSHNWGPAVRVPETGGKKDELIGFPFHWSFWMDAGGSPAGGNAWKDNGNGTFTTAPAKPKDVTYSALDLYLMGLADPSEVKPFGVLQNVVPPGDVLDPFTKGKLSASSFPHFGETPITVTATRRTLTIDDVVATNGARKPARASAKKDWTLGIVLMMGKSATAEDTKKAEAAMDVLAPKLAPAFERATGKRGTMTVVTKGITPPTTEPTPPGDPAPATPPATDPAPSPETTSSDSGGCATAPGGAASFSALGLALAALVIARRRRPLQ